MMQSYWRERARPIVAEVLRQTAGQSEQEIRKALRDAYPFGERENHPYKIWCDEIRRQRGDRIQHDPAKVQAKLRELYPDQMTIEDLEGVTP